jgi:hypothetical protein
MSEKYEGQPLLKEFTIVMSNEDWDIDEFESKLHALPFYKKGLWYVEVDDSETGERRYPGLGSSEDDIIICKPENEIQDLLEGNLHPAIEVYDQSQVQGQKFEIPNILEEIHFTNKPEPIAIIKIRTKKR